MRLVVPVLFVAACFSPAFDQPACGEGGSCPVGARCSQDNVCVTTDCAHTADGVTCATESGDGRCHAGACAPPSCGDGVIDPGEVCDGVTSDGIGCRADCSKREICGDGFVDEDEACDDGNTNPVDRCDDCRITAWTATTVLGSSRTAGNVAITFPRQLAYDRAGNLYVADVGTHAIYRVDPAMHVSVVAGIEGSSGYTGDGGPATDAQLFTPSGIAVDDTGELTILDAFNQRIRRIVRGTITTVAGAGPNNNGDYGGDGGPAIRAKLRAVLSEVIVDDRGTIYFADQLSSRIRRIDLAGTIETIAGDGSSGTAPFGDGGPATSAHLRQPTSLAFDHAGGIVVADALHQRVRRIDLTSGTITTLAGGGASSIPGVLATDFALTNVTAVGVGPSDDLYVATIDGRVWRIDAATHHIQLFAGTGTRGFSGDGGPATLAQFGLQVTGIVVASSGDVLLSDTINHRVRRVDTNGTISTFLGSGTRFGRGDGGTATAAQSLAANGGVSDAAGASYFLESAPPDPGIRRIDVAGVVSTIVPGVASNGEFARDASGNFYVAMSVFGPLYGMVVKIDPAGQQTIFADLGGSATAVAIDPATQDLYILDSACRVHRVHAGTREVFAGTSCNAADAFTNSGDGGPPTLAELGQALRGIAVGPDGAVYVAAGSVVRKILQNTITTFASFTIGIPDGIAVDGDVVYIADGASTVWQVINGVKTPAIGMPNTTTRSGAGGLAASATIRPTSITLDRDRNLILGETVGQQTLFHRVSHATGIMTPVFGAFDPPGVGAIDRAYLAHPTALVATPEMSLFAAGGVVEMLRDGQLTAVIGRYPQDVATANLARYRNLAFGDIAGLAYDAATRRVYLTEATTHRIDVVDVSSPDPLAWTIETLVGGSPGFVDGDFATASFLFPSGLALAGTKLYVADRGNHVVRVVDLAAHVVTSLAGTPTVEGFDGDHGAAAAALLASPAAVAVCGNGDLFVADTRNQRIRRVAHDTTTIATVLGIGIAASSGDGFPATAFAVEDPRGIACDATGNLFVASTTSVRLLPANAAGIVDGTGDVETIFQSPTGCIHGVQAMPDGKVQFVDACSGAAVELARTVAP